MENIEEIIKVVDLSKTDSGIFKMQLADCVVMTQGGKLLLQQRPLDWGSSAGCLTAFGGHVEPGETVMQGLVRELNEELGAEIKEADVIFIDAITEKWTGHTEIVHVHFWQDRHSTITGCYEAESREYSSVDEALAHPKIMDYLRWALLECRKRGLLSGL